MPAGPAPPTRNAAAARDLPFVGRDAQLAALVSAVQAAELGEPVVAFVAGEPGIGKSRLLLELAGRVAARVLRAACWPGEGVPPYWLWVQLLRALGPAADEAARLLREPQRDAGDARFWLFDSITDVVSNASRDQPLVLALEDLHWADEVSLRLLEFFVADLRPRRVAVVATYRDTDLHPAHPLARRLGDLARNGLHLGLTGLGRRDVETLLGAVDGAPDALVPLLLRRSGGNPLFLRELVSTLRVQGRLDATDVPAGLAPLVQRRLVRLSVAARDVLAAASAAGTDIDVPVLAAVTGAPDLAVLTALDEARTAGLVAEHPPAGLGFVHAIVRDVLYDSLPLAVRSELHSRLADVVEQSHPGERLPEVAHHLLRGGLRTGRAVEAAVRAADHSLGLLAYEQAADWYGRALDLIHDGAPTATPEDVLLLRRGEAQLASGDLPAARSSFLAAAARARARGDAEQLARAALGLGTGFGGFEVKLLDPVQVELLEEALSALDPRPSVLRACTMARLSVALSFLDADTRRLALSEQALAVAREVGEPAVLGYALTGRCDAVPGPDHCVRRLEMSSEAVQLAVQAHDDRLELLARRLRLVALLEVGDVAAADLEIERFARVAAQVRQPLYRWYVPLWRGMRELMRGDLPAASRHGAEAEQIGAAAHSENAQMLTFTQWWVRKRYEGAFAEAGTAMGSLIEPPAGEPAQTPTGWPYPAVVALQTGRPELARTLLEQWHAAGLDRRARDSEWLPESAQLAQAAVLVGSHEVAALLLEQLEPYADLFCVEGIGAAFTGSVAWYLAQLARLLGRPADADRYAERAAAEHRRVGLVADPPALAAVGSSADPSPPEPASAAMVWEGATWAVTWAGTTARLRDGKGVRDLATLLSRPGEDVHCLELVGGSDVGSAAGPVIDAQARRAYQQRIRDLQEDIDEARADNDAVRAERAEDELGALVRQLSEAFGLSGRDRTTGSAAERARSAVGWRIRAVLRQTADVHPALSRHLRNAVRTGTWCSYRPETAVRWRVERHQGRSA